MFQLLDENFDKQRNFQKIQSKYQLKLGTLNYGEI